jgi:tetratricopeptide (TPR) repeat protein
VRAHPLLALLLVPVVPLAERSAQARLGTDDGEPAVLYLWSGPQVRRLADGYRNVLADIYWLRTVQYFGGQRAFAARSNYTLLRPLIEITTSLDPRMEIAYRYGATFLAEPYPSGAGDPKAAIEILEKGVEANPSLWRLRQELALFHYFFLDDAQQAARILLEAAKLPGAPHILETLAADVLARRGDRVTARALWQRIYEEAEPGAMKHNAAVHLQQIDALDALDVIRAGAESFRAQAGRWPSSLEELRRARALPRSLMSDPVGVPFDYNPETGQASLSRTSPLWRRDLAQVTP